MRWKEYFKQEELFPEVDVDAIKRLAPRLAYAKRGKVYKAWLDFSNDLCASCLIVNMETVNNFLEWLELT